MEYNDKQLNELLGTGSVASARYKVLSIDNGDDLMGTGATGNFVEKTYNNEEKKVEKVSFAEKFSGVILAAKAQLVDKSKSPKWRTGEFNMLNKKEQIAVYPLIEGKMIKDPVTNEIKCNFGTYEQIKKARSIVELDNTVKATYNYLIVLYVSVEGEIVKIKFKGTSRGNYFDYSKDLSKLRIELYGIMTSFESYIEKSTGKYAIKFSMLKNKDGVPVGVDNTSVRNMRIEVANSLNKNTTAIEAPQNTRIEQPAEEEITIINIDEEDEKISIDDVPFN